MIIYLASQVVLFYAQEKKQLNFLSVSTELYFELSGSLIFPDGRLAQIEFSTFTDVVTDLFVDKPMRKGNKASRWQSLEGPSY